MTIKREATIKEIAHRAGVGVATVDRVIHGRPNVRPEKVDRVRKAIEHLNGERDRRMVDPHSSSMRVALVAHSGRSFLQTMMDSAATAAKELAGARLHAELHAVAEPDAQRIAGTIRDAAAAAQGLVVVSFEDPLVHGAVDEVVAGGVPVVCVTTDLPATQRLGYVGINQLHAGRSAAHLMAMILGRPEGDVVISVGNTFRCQAEREMGFRWYLRERCPGLAVREIVDVRNDPDVAFHAIKKAFATKPHPLGIYAVSGGNLGIARALAELELDAPPIFIGHELNPNSRQLLLEDRMHAVIDHDTVSEMRWCFEQLRRHRAGNQDPKLFVQQPPRLVLRENID
ncbi:MAG: LacI family DNA-binding transcriptional regulator [Geminicoccaceae bacterium]